MPKRYGIQQDFQHSKSKLSKTLIAFAAADAIDNLPVHKQNNMSNWKKYDAALCSITEWQAYILTVLFVDDVMMAFYKQHERFATAFQQADFFSRYEMRIMGEF